MAKSARASVRKRNNQVLRKNVFGPAHDARTERLSAKLQELAAKPKPESEKDTEMQVDTEVVTPVADQTTPKPTTTTKRIDTKKDKSSRIEKKGRRKPRNLVVFPTSIAKQKRIARSKKKAV